MPRTTAGTRTIADLRRRVRSQGNAVRTVSGSAQSITWTNTPFNSPTVVTACMWLKLRSGTASTFDVPFGFGNTRWYFLFNGTSRRSAFVIKSSSEKSSGYITPALTVNSWYLLCGSYDPDGGANNLKIRVYDENGVLYGSNQSTQTGTMDTASAALCFGRDPVRAYNMSVDGDDIRVYSRILSTTEMDQLAKGYEPISTNLELLARCDESSGNVSDSSGNNRTGTNNNTCTFVTSFETTRTVSS